MKILLFGKGGQVGWELQRSLAPLGELIALEFDSADYCGDFTKLAGLAETVRKVRPDVIVNAAAHTAVDKAESEPDLVRMINALAPGVLADEAEKLGAWLIHYSTDYVFNGSGTTPWKESDATGPLGLAGGLGWRGSHQGEEQDGGPPRDPQARHGSSLKGFAGGAQCTQRGGSRSRPSTTLKRERRRPRRSDRNQ